MKNIFKLLMIGAIAFSATGVTANPVKEDVKHECTIHATVPVTTDVIMITPLAIDHNAFAYVAVNADKPKTTTVVRNEKPARTASGKYTYSRQVKQYNGRIQKYGTVRIR